MHLMKSWQILLLVLMFFLSSGPEVCHRYKSETDKTLPWHGRLRAAFHDSEWKRALFGVLTLPILLLISWNEPLLKRAAVHVLQQRHSQFFVAGITLTLGMLAFWFKKKSQINYGLFEIIFGVASAFRLSRGLLVQEAMLAQWASLVGAVYVVSRGLNNIADGEKELRKRGVPLRRHKLKIWITAEVEAIRRRALG
ncbi:hypothetical protein [Granulicella arctica]|uniref:hypothetical protein n=1 Tax=Granulicella arctica TaxID=940613 RepID=UPI0021E0E4A2|nr:hypothetical protein [Granulicella arctica]